MAKPDVFDTIDKLASAPVKVLSLAEMDQLVTTAVKDASTLFPPLHFTCNVDVSAYVIYACPKGAPEDKVYCTIDNMTLAHMSEPAKYLSYICSHLVQQLSSVPMPSAITQPVILSHTDPGQASSWATTTIPIKEGYGTYNVTAAHSTSDLAYLYGTAWASGVGASNSSTAPPKGIDSLDDLYPPRPQQAKGSK